MAFISAQYRFAYPATSVCFRLSLPRHLCPFLPISTPPTLHVCTYLLPATSVRLCPATTARLRLYLTTTLPLCPFASISSWPILLLCVCLYTATTVRIRLSLPRQQRQYESISTPPTLPVCFFWSANNARLCLSLPRIHTPLTVCVYLYPDISARLRLSAPPNPPVCVYLPHKLFPVASIIFLSAMPVCIYLCITLSMSHPTKMLICAYLCPSTSASVSLSLKTTFARLRLSLLRQQCTFTSIFDTPTLTAITAQLTLSVCVCLSRHICLLASIATPPTLSVAFYNVPANTFSLRLSLLQKLWLFAPISAPPA